MKVKSGDTVRIILGIVFAVVGVAVIAISIGIGMADKRFEDKAESTTAVITDIERDRYKSGGKTKTRYHVYVQYEVDGKEYEGKLGSYSSTMYEGQQVTVLYNPENPAEMRGETPSYIYWIVFALGALFAVLGTAVTIPPAKRCAARKKLLQSGSVVTGVITDVVTDTSIKVNGRCGCKLECEVGDAVSGNKYLYSSETVMNNMHGYVGGTVSIYVDPYDKSKYYVDVSTAQLPQTEGSQVYDFR